MWKGNQSTFSLILIFTLSFSRDWVYLIQISWMNSPSSFKGNKILTTSTSKSKICSGIIENEFLRAETVSTKCFPSLHVKALFKFSWKLLLKLWTHLTLNFFSTSKWFFITKQRQREKKNNQRDFFSEFAMFLHNSISWISMEWNYSSALSKEITLKI